MISEVALQEFKKLYVEEFGEIISDKQAVELSTNLLTLFHHIYRPVKKDWLEAISDKKITKSKLQNNERKN
jgi:hypothetical protein